MPKRIPEQDRARFAKRHKELVQELNSFIDNKKDKIGENEAQLDKPEIVETYYLAKEMEEMKQAQNQILERYASKNPVDEDDKKWLLCAVKTEDTPYAKSYNAKLFRDYQANPDKVKAMLFRKVMTFDPRKIMDCKDNNLELLKFYKDNYELVDLADVLANSKDAPFYDGLNPDFVRAIDQMSEPLNVIAIPKHLAEDALTEEFYAMPEVNDNQATAIVIAADDSDRGAFPKYVRDTLESTAGNDITNKPDEYFRAVMNAHPVPTDGSFLSTYVAVEYNNNIEPTYLDFTDVVNDPVHNGIFRRQETESFKIRAVNREFARVYQNSWMKAFNKMNKFEKDSTVQETLGKHKGGFWEKVFRTTSNEYKEYEKALEDYHNPNSSNYLNDKNLRNKANAYLDHKRDKDGDLDLEKMDETSKNRTKLVYNTLQILDKTDSIEISADKELNEGYPAQAKSFLSENDVSDMSFEQEENYISQSELDNENYINQDDMEM